MLASAPQEPGADSHLVWIMDIGAAGATVALAKAVVVHAVLLGLLLLLGLPDDGQAALDRAAGQMTSGGGSAQDGAGGPRVAAAGGPPCPVDGHAGAHGARQLIGRHAIQGAADPAHAAPPPALLRGRRLLVVVRSKTLAILEERPGRLDPPGPPGERRVVEVSVRQVSPVVVGGAGGGGGSSSSACLWQGRVEPPQLVSTERHQFPGGRPPQRRGVSSASLWKLRCRGAAASVSAAGAAAGGPADDFHLAA